MRKNAYLFDFDFSKDFAKVLELEIEEDSLEEDPFTMDVKVGLSKHAIDRMENTAGRWVDEEDLIDLIKEKGDRLFNLSIGEEFALVRNDRRLAVVGTLYQSDNYLILSVATVIRNVIIKNGIEEERKIYITRGTKCV